MGTPATLTAVEIIAIIGAIAGFVGAAVGLSAFARVKSQNKKDCADANESVANAVHVLVDPLTERVAALEIELRAWKNWAERLVLQVRGLGHEPVPFEEIPVEWPTSRRKGRVLR